MKVRDLTLPVTPLVRPLVILGDCGDAYDFRDLESGARFAAELQAPLPGSIDGVVFAGVGRQLTDNPVVALAAQTTVQVWIPVHLKPSVGNFFEQPQNAVIVALSIEDEWIKIQVEPDAVGRPIDDFIMGIAVGAKLTKEQTQTVLAPAVSDGQGDSLKVADNQWAPLVDLLVQKGKPLKRFLPHWAVRRIYRLIGALR